MNRTEQKGLDIALDIAKKTGIELRVAVADNDLKAKQAFETKCREDGVEA